MNDDEPTDDHLLRIYLHDHLAGAAAGSARSRRLAETTADHPSAALFRELAGDIAYDHDQLRRLADELQIGRARGKLIVARIAEWLGQAKLNGRVLERSPLGVLVDLEILRAGVLTKLSLWESLREGGLVAYTVDIGELCRSAARQLETLGRLHSAEAARLWGRTTR